MLRLAGLGLRALGTQEFCREYRGCRGVLFGNCVAIVVGDAHLGAGGHSALCNIYSQKCLHCFVRYPGVKTARILVLFVTPVLSGFSCSWYDQYPRDFQALHKSWWALT